MRLTNEAKFMRAVSLLLVIGIFLNLAGLSVVTETVSYLSDTETSSDNLFNAGVLDFTLDSPKDFNSATLAPGESARREINFLNAFNDPKYRVIANNFEGGLCDYLVLEASLDGGASVSMKLTGFISDIVNFSEPDLWSFKLTLAVDAPEEIGGQTCQFNFMFSGSQSNNDLPLGVGVSDSEEIINNVAAKFCDNYETKNIEYWKSNAE